MKNIVTYYIAILAPLLGSIFLVKAGLISSSIFLFSLLFYSLIYRTYTDGKRLVEKNIIAKNKMWRLILPGLRFGYFKELYLK